MCPIDSPAAFSEAQIYPDRTAHVLEFLHELLTSSARPWKPESDLQGLARAFAAQVAGAAVLVEALAPARWRVAAGQETAPAAPWPWEGGGNLVQPDQVREKNAGGMAFLGAAVEIGEGVAWLVWLEDNDGRAWTPGERAALQLAAGWLARLARPKWEATLAAQRRRRRLEEAAALAGRLAHDFGNVLTGVLGFGELTLAQLSSGSAPHRQVQEMFQAAQSGARMVERLARFSRRRPTPLRFSPLRDGLARLGKDWPAAIALEIDVPEGLPPVALEAEGVNQALGPILENAREAAGPGGRVTVTARMQDVADADCLAYLGNVMPGRHVEVAISDTGAGIPPTTFARLFRELFLTTKPGRRGLGLAAAYGALQANHGGLLLGPGTSGGTTVRIVLPAATAPAQPRNHVPGQAAPREKVLVVDDDPLTLDMVCTVLKRAGYRVQQVAGGKEALDAYRAAGSDPFGMVLSDVVMPAMNGFDLARRLQGLDPSVKLLFVTGHVAQLDQNVNPPLRNVNLLPKPFRPDGLLRAVRATLDCGEPVLAH
jgi:signal transduction histidine kinase/ActR/RegA family two-component response regulator